MSLPSQIDQSVGTPLAALGYGVSGPHGTPLLTTQQSVALISKAIELGIRHFDTAPAYGGGLAEKRLGLALKIVSGKDLSCSTKVGVFSAGLSGKRRDFQPDSVEQSVRDSLKRLQVEGVDILFLHGPAPCEMTSGLLKRLAELKNAGAFKKLGLCGRGEELNLALDFDIFYAVMAPMHGGLRACALARLEAIKTKGLKLYGIETRGEGPPKLRFPTQLSDLYGVMKALKAKGQNQSSAESAQFSAQSLKTSLANPLADVVMMTTARMGHLEDNAITAGLIP